MRGKLLFVLFLLAIIPVQGWSQSTLNFPKLFTAGELPLSGFAIVNPNSSSATVTYKLYSATGTTVATGTQTVPSGGQLAKSGDQIFTTLGSGGWVQATSTTTGLQGFWLNYAGDISYIDGAEAAATALDQVIPLIAGTTELNIANPGATSNSVTIRLLGEAGTELGTAVTASIPASGVYKSDVATAFPAATMASARYIRVTGSIPAAATALVRGYLVSTDTAVVNGVDRSGTNTQMNFPHVVSGIGGGGNYTTEVGVTNLSATAQTVTISFTPEAGGAATSVTRPIPANGALRATAQSLFSFNQAEFKNGWIRVSGTSPIGGFVAYADSVAGGVAVVSVQETPRTQMVFAHIADLNPFYTGIAVLNTNATAASVSVSAMTPAGALIGNGTFTVAAGAKTAKLLLEVVPQTQTRTSDGGFLFISSNVALYGIELFFNRNLSGISNVAAGSIAAGITYVPPTPPTPVTITTVTPTSVARGASLTINGTGYSPFAVDNIAVFKTASGGTVEATAFIAASASMNVTVPATAVTGPITTRVKGLASTGNSPIIEVRATATTQVQSSVAVTGGASATVDVYVAPAAGGALNITSVGLANVGASEIAFGTSSVEIARGATKDLVLSGDGMTLANGSTLTISGTGVTISDVRFQTSGSTTLMIVNIVISSTATLGPRNIMVTNTNLDTTILTGGIFIR